MATSSLPAPVASHILALFGPTASGKTAVAGVLRERLDAEVISADSASVYAGLPILTAAPPYPARLVGIMPVTESMSVGAYQPLAHRAIDEVLAEGRLPLVAGGTGLYFRVALAELGLPVATERRAFWEQEYERLGAEAAHAALRARDVPAASRVHPNDRKRVVRALELAEAGTSLAPASDRLWTSDTRLPTIVVALDLPLAELDRRIEVRTRAMVEQGVIEEARAAWAAGPSVTAAKVLGLEQFATLPVDQALIAVTQSTKRLARYQRKWLRRLTGVVTLDGDRPAEEIADEIVALERPGERLSRH
jgi:tRNA dimethylallyltransferase